MHNDLERILISEEELKGIVERIAMQIDKDFNGEEVFLAVILKGSIIFAADLMRAIKSSVMIDFMQASSYGEGTTSSRVVTLKMDLKIDIKDKNVIVVEDIVDSGNTLSTLKDMLIKREPKCLKICTLLDKPERRETDIRPDYVGTTIPDEFVVGYGLDYAEKYRDLPYVGILARRIYESNS